MSELDKLFPEFGTEGCQGCRILEKNKAVHCYKDWEKCEEADVLFMSDSLKYSQGEHKAFSIRDMALFGKVLARLECTENVSIEFAASIKCPGVTEKEIKTTDKNICRQYLDPTIDKIKPKLVYVCGGLAMDMLIRKKGLTSKKNAKRGKLFRHETEAGHQCLVAPIFHPFTVIQEPKNFLQFEVDIVNAFNRVILGRTVDVTIDYELITDVKQLEAWKWLFDYQEPMAVDIETNGLDFTIHDITTISIATDDGIIAIPYKHKEFTWNPDDRVYLSTFLRRTLENNAVHVFHNAKFDVKFLIQQGIYPTNVMDTQIMAHQKNENVPNGLMECVKREFPGEIDNIC